MYVKMTPNDLSWSNDSVQWHLISPGKWQPLV